MLDAEGSTPLHLAVLNDSPQCVKLLLTHRADINISKSHDKLLPDVFVQC